MEELGGGRGVGQAKRERNSGAGICFCGNTVSAAGCLEAGKSYFGRPGDVRIKLSKDVRIKLSKKPPQVLKTALTLAVILGCKRVHKQPT